MSFADRRELFGSHLSWLHTWPQRYGFALLAVLIATVLRYLVGLFLGLNEPFVLFYPAVAIVALLAGFGPGIVATVVAMIAGGFFFLEPVNSFQIRNAEDIVGPLLFLGTGMVICGLVQVSRGRETRLQEFERVIEGLEEMIVVVDRDYRYVIANQS